MGFGDPENPSLCHRLAGRDECLLRTVIVAPMTTTIRHYPSRVNLTFARKKGQVALDRIRTIDRSRLVRKLGRLDDATGIEVATILTEMFAIG
jgi:mRNA interferase MazF